MHLMHLDFHSRFSISNTDVYSLLLRCSFSGINRSLLTSCVRQNSSFSRWIDNLKFSLSSHKCKSDKLAWNSALIMWLSISFRYLRDNHIKIKPRISLQKIYARINSSCLQVEDNLQSWLISVQDLYFYRQLPLCKQNPPCCCTLGRLRIITANNSQVNMPNNHMLCGIPCDVKNICLE